MASIGLISDVHATPAPVAEALAIFAQAGVEHIFCAGDIAGHGEAVEESYNKRLIAEDEYKKNQKTILKNYKQTSSNIP